MSDKPPGKAITTRDIKLEMMRGKALYKIVENGTTIEDLAFKVVRHKLIENSQKRQSAELTIEYLCCGTRKIIKVDSIRKMLNTKRSRCVSCVAEAKKKEEEEIIAAALADPGNIHRILLDSGHRGSDILIKRIADAQQRHINSLMSNWKPSSPPPKGWWAR